MEYSCEHCSYRTSKKANFIRHINRKFKCYSVDPGTQNVDPSVDPGTQNVDPSMQNVDPSVDPRVRNVDPSVDPDKSKKPTNHRCEICFKTFSSRFGKYKHKRNVLCHPSSENPLTVKESTSSTTISNIQNNNNQVTTNSNNNNTVNNIIQYNAFGEEGIERLEEFLGDDSRILERLKQVGKKKLYGVRDIQNDIFFNPENPTGFTIIKPDKYGSSVRVRNSEGEFEYMEFDDVRDPMLNYIEKYINIYNKTRNKYKVKFKDPKEWKILHNFFKIMNNDLDIYLNEDLKEDLNIMDQSNISEQDETGEDENTKYKQFDKVSLDNIHAQTKKFFKCKKGEFVLKEKDT